MTTPVVTLDTNDQSATMVSQREVPWMKLGKLVDEPLTAAEAAEAGGLNFTVSLHPIFYGVKTSTEPGATPVMTRVANRRAVVRDDTGLPLGIVSQAYPVLQYGEAFDFMDGISPTYVAAGALKGGKQGFMVVRAPEKMTVLGDTDPHELFFVMRTSHDCTRAVEVSAMPLRHRCMNQLTLQSFSTGVPHRWRITHTGSMHAKLAEAKTSLGNLGAYAKRFADNAQRLAGLKVTDAVARNTLEAVLPDRPKRAEKIETILTAWHTSPTVGFDFTGWGLINAASEYFDWGRSGGSPESRFVGALQGQTHSTINRITARLLSRVS
jgi:phage/plasmid-like protein (TIGR03299 family)